jgi:hypothetical protein
MAKTFLMFRLIDPQATLEHQREIDGQEPEHLCLSARASWRDLAPGYYHGQDPGPHWMPCTRAEVNEEALAIFDAVLAPAEPEAVVPPAGGPQGDLFDNAGSA